MPSAASASSRPNRSSGSITALPQFVMGPLHDAFMDAVARGHWVFVFDWPAWARTPEAQALWKDPAAMAAATPDQLARFLTALIRSERFSEGTLDEAHESGLLLRIARRAAALADELRGESDQIGHGPGPAPGA